MKTLSFLLPVVLVSGLVKASVLQLNPQHFKQHVGKDHAELFGHSNTSKLFLDDEATNFEKLYPEETKKRLGKIVNRIDVDQNGLVSAEELTNWIDYIHKNHIKRDVQREWIIRNPDKTEKISWSRLIIVMYTNSKKYNSI